MKRRHFAGQSTGGPVMPVSSWSGRLSPEADASLVADSRRRIIPPLLAALALATAVALLAVPGVARANGVPLKPGDVLAAVGNGQVKHFSSTGTLLDTLDTTTGSSFTTGMCFDSKANLYVTDWSAQTMSKFDANGNLVAANFGSGFNTDPESCSFNASDQVYVGQADGTQSVLKFDTSGNLLGTFAPAAESRGTDWVDLAKDQCTLQYTSEGASVKQFNVCTNTQVADFATGLPAPCYAHRILPDGTVLVACASAVEHLAANGSIIKTYTLGSSDLFALNIDPDGTSFWTGDLGTGQVWHIDIASGTVLTTFNTGPLTALGGLAIVGEPTAAQGKPPSVDDSCYASGLGSAKAIGLVTTQPNELVTVYIAADGPNSGGSQTISSVTGTEGTTPVTFTRKVQENGAAGDAEIWTATVPTPGAINVTAKASKPYKVYLEDVSYKDATGVGQVGSNHSASGAPTITLNGTQANSWVWGIGFDWLHSTARTPDAGQTVFKQTVDGSFGNTFWVQSTTNPTSGGSVTINDTAPTGDPFDIAAIEIQ